MGISLDSSIGPEPPLWATVFPVWLLSVLTWEKKNQLIHVYITSLYIMANYDDDDYYDHKLHTEFYDVFSAHLMQFGYSGQLFRWFSSQRKTLWLSYWSESKAGKKANPYIFYSILHPGALTSYFDGVHQKTPMWGSYERLVWQHSGKHFIIHISWKAFCRRENSPQKTAAYGKNPAPILTLSF